MIYRSKPLDYVKTRIYSTDQSTFNIYFYSFVFILWLFTCIARLKFNGHILGFDYSLYQPDGAYYMMRTLNWISDDSLENAKLVINWYQTHNPTMSPIGLDGLLSQGNSTWAVVDPRPIYPFVSIPFVKYLGLSGMLVIPFLSLLALMIWTAFLSIKLSVRGWGLSLTILLVSSPTILRWMTPNLTDPLLAILIGAFIYFIWLNKKSKINSAVLFTLIPLISATRFSLPILLGLSALLFLRSRRLLAVIILVESVIFALPAMLANVDKPVLPEAQSHSFGSLLIELPLSFVTIAFYEIAELFVLDKLLLAFLIGCFFLSIIRIKDFAAQIFLAVLIGVWILSGINGVLGVNFRYQMPLIPTMILLSLQSISIFSKTSPARR